MRTWAALCAVLVSGLFVPDACPAKCLEVDDALQWTRSSEREQLPWGSVGLFASYAHYHFPRTNELLEKITAKIEQDYQWSMQLADVETSYGVLTYLQVRFPRGPGLRLSFHYAADRTTTMESEGFGPVRADVRAKASPVNVSCSLVREVRAGRILVAVGAGMDYYRWAVRWQFYEAGPGREEPLEDWEWSGRGVGGHGFLEAAIAAYGLHFRLGASYHRGSFDMDTDPPVITELGITPSHFEEDVSHFQLYCGLTFDML